MLEDIPPTAFKTGMLTDTGVIKATVETLKTLYTTHLPATPQSEVPGPRVVFGPRHARPGRTPHEKETKSATMEPNRHTFVTAHGA